MGTYAIEAKESEMVKKENVAGMFYADDAEVLKSNIQKFFDDAELPALNRDAVVGLIAPHAGYIYSGPIAAYSYKLIAGQNYDAVVVMAPSHYFPIETVAIYDGDAFNTPLGSLEIDKDIVQELVQDNAVVVDNSVFEREHALEVQLPFLKYAMPDAKIVPLIYGQVTMEQIKKVAAKLAQIQKHKKILVITSTDLSHYHAYDKAKELDSRTIDNVISLDLESFVSDLTNKKIEACGYAPLLASMEYYSLLGAKAHKLYYANSGDTAGDKNKVVGYTAIAGIIDDYESDNKEKAEFSLEDKKILLNIARSTLENYLDNKKIPVYDLDKAFFNEVRGAFVTLHKNGQLRGCIGNYGNEALKDTIASMAISAATKDPRFPAVSRKELDDIDIEISVLSPLKTVDSADEIILGKHGVIVSRGFRQGVFLPQVADETGWTKDEFLSYLCEHKAGLPADAWKDKKTTLKVFTAEIFSEDELK